MWSGAVSADCFQASTAGYLQFSILKRNLDLRKCFRKFLAKNVKKNWKIPDFQFIVIQSKLCKIVSSASTAQSCSLRKFANESGWRK